MSQGENLRALREKYQITQERLAEMLNVTRETVGRWEKDKTDIRTRHVLKICELFDLAPDDITSEAGGLAKRYLPSTYIDNSQVIIEPATNNDDVKVEPSPKGDNLKALREKFNITQSQIAHILGVTRETVSAWETGKIDIRQRHINRLCEIYNLQPDDLTSKSFGLAAQLSAMGFEDFIKREYTEGENLSAFRHKYRLSADRLAEILGITPQTLSDLEANKVGITQDQLHTLCNTFNIPYADIKSPTQGLAAKMKTELPLPTNALIPTSRVMVKVPLLGRIFAGNLNHAIEVPDEWANVPEEVSDKYPDSFCLTVRGDSMNKVIANGAFVLIDTTQTTPQNTYIYAVIVNGDEATIKHVRQLNNGLELIPNSTDPTFKTVVYDFSEPDCPEIQILGRAVWIGLPDDFLIRNGRL